MSTGRSKSEDVPVSGRYGYITFNARAGVILNFDLNDEMLPVKSCYSYLLERY